MRPIPCRLCETGYIPTGRNQKYCSPCGAEHERKRVRAATLKNQTQKMERTRQHKAERGCLHCGESDSVVLELHHRDPEDKHFRLKKYGSVWRHLSWKDLEEELEKCDVLCANCHVREESRLRGAV